MRQYGSVKAVYEKNKVMVTAVVVCLLLIGIMVGWKFISPKYAEYKNQKDIQYWGDPPANAWVYQDAFYLNNDTGEHVSIEDFDKLMTECSVADLTYLTLPDVPIFSFEGYEELNDGYQLGNNDLTFVSADEYTSQLIQYDAEMKEYESAVKAHNELIEKLNGDYSYVPECYVYKKDSSRITTVEVYKEKYGTN